MVLRWIAAGMARPAASFRRVNDHLHLPALRAALDATIPAVKPPRRIPPPISWIDTKVHGERRHLAGMHSTS